MVDLKYDYCDASSICMDVVVTQQERCSQNVELFFAQPTESLNLYTDSDCVMQILTNFVGNAIKFTEKGYIEIGYSSYDDSRVEFYVKDTGIGIEEEKAETIFERS